METRGFNIGELAGGDKLGMLSANINVHGSSKNNINAEGRIFDFDFNGYRYHDIKLDASYINKVIDGKVSIDDPNAQIAVNGRLNHAGAMPVLHLTTDIARFDPHTLHLTGKWPSTAFAANIACDIKGSNINLSLIHI